MLVIRIELWPQGRANEAHEIGRITISNDGTGSREVGDYDVELAHAGEFWGKPGSWKTARVYGFVRTLSPYHLIQKALDATLGRAPAAQETPRAARVSSDTKPCRGCGAPIRWTRTPQGRAMPLDPEPVDVTLDDRGPLKVVLDDGRVVSAHYHVGTDMYAPVKARVSHFATCANGDQFRGSGR